MCLIADCVAVLSHFLPKHIKALMSLDRRSGSCPFMALASMRAWGDDPEHRRPRRTGFDAAVLWSMIGKRAENDADINSNWRDLKQQRYREAT